MGFEVEALEFDQYPNLSEGADRVGGQLRGDKEGPFNGVTKSGKSLEEDAGKRCSEWRKLPESDARSGGSCRKAMLGVRDYQSQ